MHELWLAWVVMLKKDELEIPLKLNIFETIVVCFLRMNL